MVEEGSSFYKFSSRNEKSAFDRAFPQKEIKAYLQEGQPEEMVPVLDVLRRFDFPIKPGTEDLVLAAFVDSTFAEEINMTSPGQGPLIMPRGNIVPLLRASLDVFWRTFDLYHPDDSRNKFARLYHEAMSTGDNG